MSGLNSAFVTGAGGFIGRHLVRQLLADDVTVVALMMPNEPAPQEWGDRVKLVTGDVRSLVALRDEIGPVDAIFHLAAIVSDWGAHQHHVDVTVHGTEQAIELAVGWDAHFIVTTSVCAYASALGGGVLTEETPVGVPASPYEFCKQEQERVTHEAVEQNNLKATIVRPGNVFGVGSGPWVNMMVEMLRQKKPCLMGSGDWDAGLCHVDNLVAVLVAASRSNYTSGDVFNAADDFGVTWNTYLHRLSEAAGLDSPKSIPNSVARCAAPVFEWVAKSLKQTQRPAVTRQSYRLMGKESRFSIEKAQRCLDYQPVTSFEEAMKELAESFGAKAPTDDAPWVWVTGSASGLGRYLTGQLLHKGYRVLASDLQADALAQVCDEDAWDTSKVVLEALDITQLDQWHEIRGRYEEKGVSFSHLLNVAGIIRPGFSYENTAREVSLQLDVNVMGTVNGCDSLLPHFQKRNTGHIINIASFAGFGAAPGIVGYCTSKAAVRSFSVGLGMDLALSGSNVAVSCVCPDLIATPMMDQQVECGDHSRLVFSGNRPLTTAEVGNLVLGKIWKKRPLEEALPAFRKWLTKLLGLNPNFALWVFRRMESKGKANLEKIRRKNVANNV